MSWLLSCRLVPCERCVEPRTFKALRCGLCGWCVALSSLNCVFLVRLIDFVLVLFCFGLVRYALRTLRYVICD